MEAVLITDIQKTSEALDKKAKILADVEAQVKYINTKFRSMKGVKKWVTDNELYDAIS